MAYNKKSLKLVRTSSQYLYIVDNVTHDISGNISGEAWIKLTELPSVSGKNFPIIAKWDANGNNFSFIFIVDAIDRLGFIYSDNGTYASHSTDFRSNSSVVTSSELNKWIHVAFTANVATKSVTFYKNGVAFAGSANGTPVATTIYNSTAQFSIGYGFNDTSLTFFSGNIAEVRLWNTVRTAQNILDNLGKRLVGNESGLVSYYPLSGDANDVTSNARHLSASGSPTYVYDVPFTTVDKTAWTKGHKIKIDHTKVGGSANLTNYPMLVTESNLLSEVFSNVQGGEINNTWIKNLSELNLYLRGEETSGTTAADSSGKNHPGTCSRTNILNNPGLFGNGFLFSAANSDKITFTDHADLRPTSSFTLKARIKPTSITANHVVFANYSANTTPAGVIVFISADGKLNFFSARNTGPTSGTDFNSLVSTSVIPTNVWTDIACVWDGSYLKIFINGVLDSSSAWSYAPAYAATTYCRVGCNNNTGTDINFFNGYIDDLCLLHYTWLNDHQVKQAYFGSSDLRFTSDEAATQELPFEIVNFDTVNSKAEIHVKVPTVSYTTDTTIYAWYGNNQVAPYEKDAFFGQYNVWPSNGLSRHYENGSRDSTINAKDGTATDITYSNTNGKNGKYATFNGSTSKITSGFQLPTSKSSFSYALLCKPTSTNYGYLLNDRTSDYTYNIGLLYDSYFRQYFNDGAQVFTVNSATPFNVNEWHLVVFTYDASTNLAKLYVDGVFQAQTTISYYSTSGGHNLAEGVLTGPATANFYTGLMDELRIAIENWTAGYQLTLFNNLMNPATFAIPLTFATPADSERPAKMSAKASTNDYRAAKVTGKQLITAQQFMKMWGKVNTNDVRSAKIKGGTLTFATIAMQLLGGGDPTDDQRSTKLWGYAQAVEARIAKVICLFPINDERKAKLHGYATTFIYRAARLWGGTPTEEARIADALGGLAIISYRRCGINGAFGWQALAKPTTTWTAQAKPESTWTPVPKLN